MKLSQIIKQILKNWQIDLDLSDIDISEIEKELEIMSAYDKRILNESFKDYQDLRYMEAFGEFLHLNFEINLN